MLISMLGIPSSFICVEQIKEENTEYLLLQRRKNRFRRNVNK
jgi:hypothetical protein